MARVGAFPLGPSGVSSCSTTPIFHFIAHRLIAPNGDVFYGDWRSHKRFGRGIQYRAADRLFLVELYEDGKLTKRMVPLFLCKFLPLNMVWQLFLVHVHQRRAEQKRDRMHWRLAAATAEPSAESPPPLVGHTSTRVGAHIILFGGLTHLADGKEVASNDMWLLGIESGRWTRVAGRSVDGSAVR